MSSQVHFWHLFRLDSFHIKFLNSRYSNLSKLKESLCAIASISTFGCLIPLNSLTIETTQILACFPAAVSHPIGVLVAQL